MYISVGCSLHTHHINKNIQLRSSFHLQGFSLSLSGGRPAKPVGQDHGAGEELPRGVRQVTRDGRGQGGGPADLTFIRNRSRGESVRQQVRGGFLRGQPLQQATAARKILRRGQVGLGDAGVAEKIHQRIVHSMVSAGVIHLRTQEGQGNRDGDRGS